MSVWHWRWASCFRRSCWAPRSPFRRRDLYPYYDLCGRLFPSISALNDQHIGGIVIWIPPAMMSAMAVLLVINALRLHEEATSEDDADGAALAALAKSWTGR